MTAADTPPARRPPTRWTRKLTLSAVAAGLVAASCSDAGESDTASTTTSSSDSSEVEATSAIPPGGYEEPPDGGEIRVVEQGFTPGHTRSGDDHVSWGMILENTSEYTAVNVTLTVAYFDASGRSLGESQSGHGEDLPVLPAGESVAMAESGFAQTGGVGPPVARIEVTVEDAGWWPTEPPEGHDAETYPLARLEWSMTTAHDVTVARNGLGDGVISYRVPPGEAVDRTLAVIFRNAEGEIIGGVEPDQVVDVSSGARATIEDDVMDLPGFEQADIEVYVTLE